MNARQRRKTQRHQQRTTKNNTKKHPAPGKRVLIEPLPTMWYGTPDYAAQDYVMSNVSDYIKSKNSSSSLNKIDIERLSNYTKLNGRKYKSFFK